MSKLSLKNINVVYSGNLTAVKDLSLEVAANELIVLTGASGCGKSAVLRAIAGLDKLSSGEVYVSDQNVTKIAAKKRRVVMTANAGEISPRMTVYKCMCVDAKRLGASDVDSRVRKTAEQLGIVDVLTRKIREISSGQLRLALLGRAIACDADVYLLDETFAGLDAAMKDKLRAIVAGLAEEKNAAVIYATADQAEALAMECTIAAMANGTIVQTDTAENMLKKPANVEAARIFGSPAMNIFRAKLTPRDGRMFVAAGETAIRVPDLTVKKLKSDIYIGKDVYVGIRPENITADAEFVSENPGAAMDAIVEKTVFSGSDICLKLKIAGIADGLIAAIDGVNVNPGDEMRIAVEPTKLYLFDAATGENILF